LISVAGAVLGWGIILTAAVALGRLVWRLAKANGIVAPLLVGAGVRLVVMLIAHIGSLSLGDHGFLFLDDQTYFRGGSTLAHLWRQGHTPDPARPGILGTYQFGYQLFLGLLFTLGTASVLLGKLANVLFGAVTVVVAAIFGKRLLGDEAKVRAAWVTALAPTLVWWSASLLKEVLVPLLVLLGLLAIAAIPRPRAYAWLALVLGPLAILRGPAALALIVGAAVAVVVAARRAEGRWWSRSTITFAATVLGGLLIAALVVSRGHLGGVYQQYNSVVHNEIKMYQGGSPAHIPYDMVKSLLTPLPWVFDRATQNWDRGLYPGMWVLYCALPLAAVGMWRLRRMPEAWAMFAASGTSVAINAVTSGFVFRQRSMVEPLILLLALAGAGSWRRAAQASSATLVVAAGAVAVQSRSPVPVAAVLAAAGALFLLSRRLSERAFAPPPESPMVLAFRRSAATREPFEGSLGRAVTTELARLTRGAHRAAMSLRMRLAGTAPALDVAESADEGRGEGDPARLERAVASAYRAVAPTAPPVRRSRRPGAAARAAAVARVRSALVRAAPGVHEPRRRRGLARSLLGLLAGGRRVEQAVDEGGTEGGSSR
jgi:hypothetical protein